MAVYTYAFRIPSKTKNGRLEKKIHASTIGTHSLDFVPPVRGLWPGGYFVLVKLKPKEVKVQERILSEVRSSSHIIGFVEAMPEMKLHDKVALRDARPSDLDGIMDVEKSSFRKGQRASVDEMRERLALKSRLFEVATSGDKVIGYLCGIPVARKSVPEAVDRVVVPARRFANPRGGDFLMLSVGVKPDARSRNVGRSLFVLALDKVQKKGYHQAFGVSVTKKPRPLWERIGGMPISRKGKNVVYAFNAQVPWKPKKSKAVFRIGKVSKKH